MEKSRLSQYVEELTTGPTAAGVVVDRFTIPLDEYHHFLLIWLAEKGGKSQAQVASDLLRFALDDAVAEFEPKHEAYGGPDDEPSTDAYGELIYGEEAYRSDKQQFYGRLRMAWKEWVKNGKNPPRASDALGHDDRSGGTGSTRAPRRATTPTPDMAGA